MWSLAPLELFGLGPYGEFAMRQEGFQFSIFNPLTWLAFPFSTALIVGLILWAIFKNDDSSD